jgi:hypothetical protein
MPHFVYQDAMHRLLTTPVLRTLDHFRHDRDFVLESVQIARANAVQQLKDRLRIGPAPPPFDTALHQVLLALSKYTHTPCFSSTTLNPS